MRRGRSSWSARRGSIHTDPVRARVDEIVLQAIGVRNTLAALRELIAAEPLFARAAEVEDEDANGDEDEEDTDDEDT
ncbi:MAG TPA: hypothetical protein VMO26_10225 [Vicinamibacterales bacterium]|nr:hypothetical protein [Vicinamibacterales bacterium]